MRFYLTAVVLFVTLVSRAQFSDDFTDGDFSVSPVWSGDDANFEVDADLKLHLLAPAVADVSYLSTPTTNIDDVQWDFYLEMDFNPSSSNFTRVYLVSDNADLEASLNGYFVMIGNTSDEISLYRQDGASTTEILDGTDNAVDMDPVNVRIRVSRDAAGNWELLRDTTGNFSFISEGTVSDATYTTNAFFGVQANYTSSRSELFWFDDLGDPYTDSNPPTVDTLIVVSATELDVQFNEPVNVATAETTTNYSVDDGVGNPVTATVDGSDPTLVHLAFGSVFSNATDYILTINNVEDLFSNAIASPTDVSFFYFLPEAAEVNDLIITEIMADPSPVIGLPEIEFFEIHNRSDKYFDLNGWVVTDGSTSETLSNYILGPDEYVVICEEGDGTLLGISNYLEGSGIPTLTNSEDDLVLWDDLGVTIDSIHYTDEWYNDPDKDDGGWTIERKHLNTPCNDQNNWGASVDPSGGTPGAINSIWTDEDDVTPPGIATYEVLADTLLTVTFDETMDTTIAVTVSVDPAVTSLDWNYITESTLEIYPDAMEQNTLYTVSIIDGKDCWGNSMDPLQIKLGIPGSAEAEDLILNEIMFDPLTGGSDYVELYNRSDKIIDLADLSFANWSDSIANIEPISNSQYLLLPGEYALITEDTNDIIDDFSIYGIGAFVETDDLPTYPNDSGTVYLLDSDQTIIDYFHYDEDYHFDLLTTTDGKALERITFDPGMNNPDNWHSASEQLEWGTPGYQNSQFMNTTPSGQITVEPQLFSPDNDGYKDILTISLELAGTDNVVDIDIYDNQGRMVRELKDNFFVGTDATVTWDGINDEGRKAAIGTYVLLISVLDSEQNREVFKEVCVLGGDL